MSRHQGRLKPHVKVFLANSGPPPWPCHFCREPVVKIGLLDGKLAGIVHHDDHDHENNDPGNLVPAHSKCHSQHHLTGCTFPGRQPGPHSLERRQAISEGQRGREVSAKTRQLLSSAAARRFESADARQAISDAMKARHTCPEPGCGFTTNASNLTRHRRREGH